MRRRWRWAVLLGVPGIAAAHDLTGQYGPLLGSALHVFVEPDHLAASAAIGLLAGQRTSRRESGAMLGGFAASFLAGLSMSMVFHAGAAFQLLDSLASAATLVAAGLLVAIPRAFSLPLGVLVAVATGAIHGLANGLGIAQSESAVVAALGGWSAAGLVALGGAALAATLRVPWGFVAVRVLGSWVAALGLILAGVALRS